MVNELREAKPREESSEELWVRQQAIDAYLLFRRTHDMVARYVETELAGQGTSVAQYGVLVNLHRLQPCSLTDLSTTLFRTAGNITSLIDRMEADGTVERLDHSEDRRITLVRLTEKGEAILRSLRPYHRIFLSDMMSCLTDEELSGFTDLLEKLKRSLEQISAAAG
jgi:MarR family 2-MHQ and catechol resistance regulon transcriptional repressor